MLTTTEQSIIPSFGRIVFDILAELRYRNSNLYWYLQVFLFLLLAQIAIKTGGIVGSLVSLSLSVVAIITASICMVATYVYYQYTQSKRTFILRMYTLVSISVRTILTFLQAVKFYKICVLLGTVYALPNRQARIDYVTQQTVMLESLLLVSGYVYIFQLRYITTKTWALFCNLALSLPLVINEIVPEVDDIFRTTSLLFMWVTEVLLIYYAGLIKKNGFGYIEAVWLTFADYFTKATLKSDFGSCCNEWHKIPGLKVLKKYAYSDNEFLDCDDDSDNENNNDTASDQEFFSLNKSPKTWSDTLTNLAKKAGNHTIAVGKKANWVYDRCVELNEIFKYLEEVKNDLVAWWNDPSTFRFKTFLTDKVKPFIDNWLVVKAQNDALEFANNLLCTVARIVPYVFLWKKIFTDVSPMFKHKQEITFFCVCVFYAIQNVTFSFCKAKVTKTPLANTTVTNAVVSNVAVSEKKVGNEPSLSLNRPLAFVLGKIRNTVVWACRPKLDTFGKTVVKTTSLVQNLIEAFLSVEHITTIDEVVSVCGSKDAKPIKQKFQKCFNVIQEIRALYAREK